MSNIKIRSKNNVWVDPCTTPTNVFSNKGWVPVDTNARFYINNEWVYLVCAPDIRADLECITGLSGRVAFTMTYYKNGVNKQIIKIDNGSNISLDINPGLPVTLSWDNSKFKTSVDGALKSGGFYSFVPSAYTYISSEERV